MTDKKEIRRPEMFGDATPFVFKAARFLRKQMTNAEILLWEQLKTGIGRFKFRRQHPINLYFADFFCFKAKLIIELDGYIHQDNWVSENDRFRQRDLERSGYTIIRFSNEEVINDISTVIQTITLKITELKNKKASL